MYVEGRKQVEIIEAHDATDADMLTLKVGDILIVYQELEGKIKYNLVHTIPVNTWFKVGCCYYCNVSCISSLDGGRKNQRWSEGMVSSG